MTNPLYTNKHLQLDGTSLSPKAVAKSQAMDKVKTNQYSSEGNLMDQEETLRLFKQGKEAWNQWAEKQLAEQKELEETGKWKIDASGEAENEATKTWFENSYARFQCNNNGSYNIGSSSFESFIFPGSVSFLDFKFQYATSFQESTFKHKVKFIHSKFECKATFENTIFENEAIFKNATFHDKATFAGAVFKNEALFDNAMFEKETTFHATTFHHPAYFQKCNFKEDVRFIDTKFLDYITFEHANFYKLCKFYQSTFSPEIDANFCNAIFHYNTWFGECEFHGNTIFARLQSKLNLVFRDTTFHQSANFDAIRAEHTFSLEKVTFKKDVPNFIQAHFEEAPRLDDITFGKSVAPGSFWNSILSPISTETKARYQALKRLAIEAHDHENEQRFWAGELRSDRSLRTEDNQWKIRPLFSAFWWGNIAYGAVSNYGRSIIRPLFTWIALTILVAILHISTHTPTENNNCNICRSALHVAVKTGSLGLIQDPSKRIIFVRDYACLYGTQNDKRQTPNIPGAILAAEGFQALFSAILIFLCLLGIRNNFKLK